MPTGCLPRGFERTAVRHVPTTDAALERALKRRVWRERWTFQATGPAGLEALLADEVGELLPDESVEVTSGRVRFEAEFDALYKLALTLRSADALRIRVAEEAAASFPMLHDHLARVSWRWWLPARCRLDVRVRSRRSRVRDAGGIERAFFQAVRSHDVEVVADDDRSRNDDVALLRVRLELVRDRIEVWLDVAGEPLHHRRGSRWTVPGAIRETTAAALVLAARPYDADLIVDPFCGSGTLLEEFASWRSQQCPGATRHFAMEASPAWNPARMRHAVRTVCPDRPTQLPPLIGVDVSAKAIVVARHNLEQAECLAVTTLIEADARSCDLLAHAERAGASRPLLIANPPYGRRARIHGAESTALVRHLLGRVPGWRVALVHPEPDVLTRDANLVVERVIHFRMRGLPNAMIIGHVRGDAGGASPMGDVTEPSGEV